MQTCAKCGTVLSAAVGDLCPHCLFDLARRPAAAREQPPLPADVLDWPPFWGLDQPEVALLLGDPACTAAEHAY